MNNKIYTAVIIDRLGVTPWISAFSSQEKRDAFLDEARERILKAETADDFEIYGDSGVLDDADYLHYLPNPVSLTANEPWVLTDDDTMQYVRKRGAETYDLIQLNLINPDTERYSVLRDTVRIPDYTYNDILMILKTYGYSSWSDVVDQYGEESYLQIIAECIFEYYCDLRDEPIFTGTEAEAIAFINEYVTVREENQDA